MKIPYQIEKFYNTKVKRFFQKIFNFRKKELSRDKMLGEIYLTNCKHAIESANVIAPKGIAAIKELKSNNWILISFGKNKYAEHKIVQLKQLFVQIVDPFTKRKEVYPLSYQDYKYIDYKNNTVTYAEVEITKKRYAKLSSKEIEKREYFPLFSKYILGLNILQKLKDMDYVIIKKSEIN